MGLILWMALAFGGSREDAEMERYVEDMNTLAERQAWPGVERSYEKILELQGVEISREVHLTAASSARALGDMAAVLDRLKRAQTIKPNDEVGAWISSIEEDFAPVELRSVPPRDLTLTPETMPFEPDKRGAVELAGQRLTEDGEFVGLLPVGQYTLQGQEFEVIAGVTTRVELSGRDLKE